MDEKIGTGVSSDKENVEESQSESQSRSVAPPLDTHIGCRVGGVTVLGEEQALFGWKHPRVCS